MAINTDIGTQLWSSATGALASYTKLVPITSAPATGSMPTKVPVTALEDAENKYRKGRRENPDLEFSFPHETANMTAVLAVDEAVRWFMIIYQDGSGVTIKGEASVWIDAVELDSMVAGKLGIIAQEITIKTIAEVTALKTV